MTAARMHGTPEESQRLDELDKAANKIDNQIHRLLAEREHLMAEAGKITTAIEERVRPEITTTVPRDAGMNLELLASWLALKVQRLEDENLWGLEGRLRDPRIMPGMELIMVWDDGYCTQLVIHFDADRFQGLVGYSLEDQGQRWQPDYDEQRHAEFTAVLLMGEYPIKFAQECRLGEINWASRAPGYPHPESIGELVDLAQRNGAWLHPRISEIPRN
ncbi:hypothetical protein [Corynebacterium sp. A21]|uniref:hypothetical protein n=1 Tax=Corynebacterium sp. A21 TaxID=3457318 RepID=UPI003FD64BD6